MPFWKSKKNQYKNLNPNARPSRATGNDFTLKERMHYQKYVDTGFLNWDDIALFGYLNRKEIEEGLTPQEEWKLNDYYDTIDMMNREIFKKPSDTMDW